MLALQHFQLKPLHLVVRWAAVAPLLLVVPQALAGELDGGSRTIDSSTSTQAWTLENRSTLIANGATTLDINASNSTLTMTNSQTNGAVRLDTGSIGTFTGGVITATGPTSNALDVVRAQARIIGTALSGVRAMVVTGSTVQVDGSVLTGNVREAVTLAHGDATFSNSQLKGVAAGVWIQTQLTARTGANRLVLDNSRVEATAGSAIKVSRLASSVVNDHTDVDITIGQGTELIGSNGNMLEVADDNFSVVFNVIGNDQLAGNILIDGDSDLQVNLSGSTVTGDIRAGTGSTLGTSLVGSTLNGNFSVDQASEASLALDGSEMTGDISAGGASTLAAQFSQSRFTGDISGTGGSTVDVVAQGSELTGNISAAGASGLDAQLNQTRFTGDISSIEGSTASVSAQGSQLFGNIVVDATSQFNLALDQSQLTGDVLAEAGADMALSLSNGSVLTGRLENVDTLAVDSGAQWNMTADNSVGELRMDGGRINFGDASQFLTLNAGSLAGNGTFAMDVDFPSGQHDFLNIEGNATGSHELLISSTGTDPVIDTSLHLVHADSGDAEFDLVGGDVDFGTWSYGLVKNGNDWFLDANHKTISPGTESVLALFNAGPTVWYGELSTLRTRMGELRLNGGQSGAWMRGYGNKFNVATENGLGYKQNQQGFSLGADAPLPWGDGQWLVGVMAGHSDSDLTMRRGTTATVKSNYVGVYATWLDADSGYYFDGVLKANRFNNDSKVNLSDGKRAKGDYDNTGVGGSVEFGKHIVLGNGYFVEPYTQLSAVAIEGKDYTLDNGMRAEGEVTRSLLGKLGATAGRTFDLGEGAYAQPYVRAAYAHEFAKSNTVQVNDNSFNNDLSGSRGELGTGIAVSVNDKWQVHADFDYANGDSIEQPWGASVGMRYSW